MILSYKQLYFALFAAMSRATDALDRGNAWEARRTLIDAMQAAEAAHLDLDILKDQ